MARKSRSPEKLASDGMKQPLAQMATEQREQSLKQPSSSPAQSQPLKTPTTSPRNTLRGSNLSEVETRNLEATMTTPTASPHQRTLSDSSNLSSAPSDIGKTPAGLVSPEKRVAPSPKSGDGSPVRRSLRKRKATIRADKVEQVNTVKPSRKRRKISDTSTNSGNIGVPSKDGDKQIGEVANHEETQGTAPTPDISKSGDTSSPTTIDKESVTPISDESLPKPGEPTKPISDPSTKKPVQTTEEKRIIKQFQKKVESMLHVNAIHPRWPEFKANEIIMYGADATTLSTPDHIIDSPSPSPAKRAMRGAGRGGGRGGSNNGRGRGNGRGGRGGMAPSRGRDESPEPPQKQVSTEEDQNVMRIIRKRQAELRQFFNNVGGQQRDILDQLATRDLNKLVKKAKAHKQVPEYDELVEELDLRRLDVEDLIRQEYELKKAQAIKEMEMEAEVIEEQYRRKIEQVKEEHVRGAAGDIALFKNAHAAKADETYTQSGSEADYFPYYHEIPEADSHVRGYISNRITDEQPFKVSLPSFDDLAKRDVIEDEVTRPVIESIQKDNVERRAEIERENSEHRAEELRKKTQNMTALTAEAEKQLEEMKGYLIPRPFREAHEQQYALSRLADMADYMRSAYPNQQYIYMPLPPGVKFPKEALSFKTTPGGAHLFPQPMLTPPQVSVPQTQKPPVESSMRSTQPPELPVQPTRPPSDPSLRSNVQVGPQGPHRQIAMKPLPPPIMYSRPPSSDQSRRSSFRSLAPQPQPLPPQPYPPPQHHQQYTFVTPQQPPQSAQFVGPPIAHNIHHHRQNSSASINGAINGVNNNNRSRSSSLVITQPLSMAAQQNKIPMQFVNSTPESARQKAAAQAASAANSASNANGKGRTLLPKP